MDIDGWLPRVAASGAISLAKGKDLGQSLTLSSETLNCMHETALNAVVIYSPTFL